jgi:hypothetical protein
VLVQNELAYPRSVIPMRPLLLTTALAAFGVSALMLLGISRAAAADPPLTPLTPQIISDSPTTGPARLSLRDRLRSWFARDESIPSGTTYSPSGSTYRGYPTTPTTTSGTGRYYYSPYGGYSGPTGPTKEPPLTAPSAGR